MSRWNKIPVKQRKDFYKRMSAGKSLLLKTAMLKDIYKGLECVVLNCGTSVSEFPKEKIEEFCQNKPVFTVKTSTLKFKDITDVCITNFYATFQFPKERDYIVLARQEMPLGYKNWVNPDLIEKGTFNESFDNEPDVLWGSDVTARHSNSVVVSNRWHENSLDNSPYNRILGPGIMNDMIIPILVHSGVKKISILGWDGAKIEKDGSINHFYDSEPEFKPTLNYISENFNVNNLKSDMDECEQQIGQKGEQGILKYLAEKEIEIEILTKNSLITEKISRNYVLYNNIK